MGIEKTTRGGAVVSRSGFKKSSGDHALVAVTGKLITTQSTKAYLVVFEATGKQWLPKSQIKKEILVSGCEEDLDAVYTYHIPTWLAEVNDLEYEELEEEGEVEELTGTGAFDEDVPLFGEER